MQEELQAAIVSLPNFPADIVPEGKTAEDNLVVKLVESYTNYLKTRCPTGNLRANTTSSTSTWASSSRAQDSPSTKAREPVCSVR